MSEFCSFSSGKTHKNSRQHGTLLGYHGSSLENFLSIVRHGFQEKCIKYGHGLFGDGIYFSTDPLVAKNFVSYYQLPKDLIRLLGPSFVNGIFGHRIGCCIVCQVAKHPTDVKFACKDAGSYIGINGGPGIAKHYVMASSTRYIRHRYLFLYSKFDGNSQRLLFIIVLAYILVLGLIFFIKSKQMKRLLSSARF